MATESETLEAQLTSVRAAILALETGKVQSYEVGGHQYTYLDIEVLYARERRLLAYIGNQEEIEERMVEF